MFSRQGAKVAKECTALGLNLDPRISFASFASFARDAFDSGSIMETTKLKIPAEWRRAAEEILSHGGPVMVIGAPGSGKTTFCQYLTANFCRQGKKVAWIDGDPGQPFVGPPAVLSLSVYTAAEELLTRKGAMSTTFIGNTSPVGHLLEMIAGLQKLAVRAAAYEPDLLIVNTCGLVHGGAARELGFHEIDMSGPKYIVALQKGSEVEHLLSPHSHRAGLLMLRMPVAPEAKLLTREARLASREFRFKEYFRGAGFQEIEIADVGIHGHGIGTGERLAFYDVNKLSKIVGGLVVHAELSADRLFMMMEGEYSGDELFTAKEAYSVREVTVLKRSEMDHLLLGLNDDQNLCMGLGILREFDVRDQVLRVITPLRDLSAIRHVVFGSLRVSPAGTELGRM
jgi:polynucleotide 5'-hydroxyl-kinase GRC3/NOL9